jgi:hypothetical protein
MRLPYLLNFLGSFIEKPSKCDIFLTGIFTQSLKTISLFAFLLHILVCTESFSTCPSKKSAPKRIKKGIIRVRIALYFKKERCKKTPLLKNQHL